MKYEGKYRMYYRAYNNRAVICVAESKDGKTFTKPNIGKVEFCGSKDNNIVFWRDNGRNVDTFTVIYDTNPDCKPEEKFKALVRDASTDILDYYASADGYDFQYIKTIELNGTFDSYNTVFWDETEKQYRMYYRGYHHPDGTDIEDISDDAFE